MATISYSKREYCLLSYFYCPISGTESGSFVLLSIPWINVPSASEYASEVGHFDNFISPKQITAFLGIAPKKFKTGKVSFENGHITKKGKNQGRSAVITIANNLVQGNDYYAPLYLSLIARGKAKQQAKVAIANKFIRNSFRMVENSQLFEPPAWTGPTLKNDPISKLKDFLHNNTNDKTLIEQIVAQAQQTLDTILKQNNCPQEKENEVIKQTPQPSKTIYRRLKRESIGSNVVFSRIKPSNYKGPTPIGNVLENMVTSGKLPSWILTGKGPQYAQLD